MSVTEEKDFNNSKNNGAEDHHLLSMLRAAAILQTNSKLGVSLGS